MRGAIGNKIQRKISPQPGACRAMNFGSGSFTAKLSFRVVGGSLTLVSTRVCRSFFWRMVSVRWFWAVFCKKGRFWAWKGFGDRRKVLKMSRLMKGFLVVWNLGLVFEERVQNELFSCERLVARGPGWRKGRGPEETSENNSGVGELGSALEPRRPFDPLRPSPLEPVPSPLRPPGQYVTPRDDELVRLLKEILDRLVSIEKRLKAIEEAVKIRR